MQKIYIVKCVRREKGEIVQEKEVLFDNLQSRNEYFITMTSIQKNISNGWEFFKGWKPVYNSSSVAVRSIGTTLKCNNGQLDFAPEISND